MYIKQTEVTEKLAALNADIQIEADVIQNVKIEVESEGKILAFAEQRLEKGKNDVSISFEIPSPRLWWSNGLGTVSYTHLMKHWDIILPNIFCKNRR